MEQKKRRFAVLTGGGDCPGLNAVIRAVVKTFLQNDCEVYGVLNGFNGLINDNLKLMDYAAVSGILPRGGTILGTTNRDNPFHFAVEENGELVYKDMREKVVENLRKYDIEALVVIGGDGSLNIGGGVPPGVKGWEMGSDEGYVVCRASRRSEGQHQCKQQNPNPLTTGVQPRNA